MRLGWRGLGLEVRGAPPALLSWLASFLCPPFAVDVGPGVPVEVTVDPSRFRALELGEPIDVFTGDEAHVALRRVAPNAVCDPGIGALLRLCADGAEIVLAADERLTRIFVLRVLRELAAAHAENGGDLHLHASGALADGRAILFVGPRGVGKTTLLFYAMAQPGAALLSNDRVYVDGTGTARGMPTILSVRPGTLAFFPEEARRLAGLATPVSLAHLGIPLVTAAPAALVVLVEPDRIEHGFRLEPLDGALPRSALLAGGRSAGFFPRREREARELEERMRLLSERLPCRRLALAPDAYSSPELWSALRAEAQLP